jgi:ABC-type uncharacterized transport system substrate-binding protein
VKRRTFIAGLGTAAVWPLVARAQQPSRKVRIGVLLAGTPASYSARANALLEGLRDLGYEEGKTVTFEWRWWNNQVERIPELAAELVSLDVQAIVMAGTPARQGAQERDTRHTNSWQVLAIRSLRDWSRALRTRAATLRALPFFHLTLVESGWSC